MLVASEELVITFKGMSVTIAKQMFFALVYLYLDSPHEHGGALRNRL